MLILHGTEDSNSFSNGENVPHSLGAMVAEKNSSTNFWENQLNFSQEKDTK